MTSSAFSHRKEMTRSMGQRVIPVAVTAEYVGGDGVTLGAAGSHDSVVIEYDFRAAGPMWDDVTVRYVLWTNPQGNTTNRVNLGVDKLVPGYDNKVYHAAPTADAMCVSGWAEMVVVGAIISDGNEVIKVKTEPSRFRVLPGSSSAADNEGIAATVADQLQAEIETVDSRKVSKPQEPYDPDGEPGQFLVSRGDGLTEWADFSPEAVEEVLDKHPEWVTRVGEDTITAEMLRAGSVIMEKLGADVQTRLESLTPVDPISSESTRPAQAKAVYDAIAAETAARKQRDDELAAADDVIRSQMISPFAYKGSCTYANLPANPSVNDAWYVTDRNCLMAWNGSAWGQAGPDSYDLLDSISLRTKDSDLTDLICKASVKNFQNETSSLTINMVAGVNATQLDLDKDVITYSDNTGEGIYATGSSYFSFLVSSGARFLGANISENIADLLTTDDFAVFPPPRSDAAMMLELSMVNETSSKYREYSGQTAVNYPQIKLATKNLLTGEVSIKTLSSVGINVTDANSNQFSRTYFYDIAKNFPEAIENLNIAVIFTQRRSGVNGSTRMRFYYRASDSELGSYWDTELTESVRAINQNIFDGADSASTLLFITDLHWNNNKHKSPALAKKILDACDVDYFVNGGDMIYGTHESSGSTDEEKAADKTAALDELTNCMAAFRAAGCRLPMITLYGNHDRNRDGITGGHWTPDQSDPKNDWKRCIRRDEHLRVTMFREIYQKYGIHSFPSDNGMDGVVSLSRYTGDGGAGSAEAYYWEDDRYRYAAIYWYKLHDWEEILDRKMQWEKTPESYSAWKTAWDTQTKAEKQAWFQAHLDVVTPFWVPEIFDTEKPVVILTHGIYFSMYVDPASYESEESAKDGWLLDVIEKYSSKIRCIIQGHSHVDGMRYAYRNDQPQFYGAVPIIAVDCDMFKPATSKAGTISEQSMAAITIAEDEIRVIKIGRGSDWPVIKADPVTPEFTYNYQAGSFVFRDNP